MEYLETTPDVKFLPYDMAVDIMENLSGKQYPEIDMSDIVDLTGVIRETLSKFWSNMLTSDISTEKPQKYSVKS